MVHVKSHSRQGVWERLASGVMERPWLAVVLVGGFLVLSALPIFTMKLGQPTIDSLPSSDFKRGYQLIAQDFAAGVDDPGVVIDGDATDAGIQQQAQSFTEMVKANLQFGSVNFTSSDDGKLTAVDVVTVADPFSQEGEDAARSIRETLVPQVLEIAQTMST